MSRFPLLLSVACAMAMALPAPAPAQEKVPHVIVAIYHIAPGKQLEFLKWMAAREAIDREAGVGATQWYAHMNGDSWDYVAISPDIDDATSDKLDEMARKKGLKIGAPAGLEFRQMVASHTDTMAAGPLTASQMVDRATKP
ncbi:hypothetical protein [Lysobacter niastensis]|uniref:GYD domain-containing protein n=1 Tax=Lysobacter niastensis TaxID=380629 RepID=A0ABS0B5Y8_9GAMM|nr:hypothetical protein [Lysobacter niastensis]MBF6024373.1 hypothetical protein [Lysobacter niastensis]